jgi:hypothetical protein
MVRSIRRNPRINWPQKGRGRKCSRPKETPSPHHDTLRATGRTTSPPTAKTMTERVKFNASRGPKDLLGRRNGKTLSKKNKTRKKMVSRTGVIVWEMNSRVMEFLLVVSC